MCGMHALNNILANALPQQHRLLTKPEMDGLCEQITPTPGGCIGWCRGNPRRSWWGTGFYDVNVLFAAVESRGCRLSWVPASSPFDSCLLNAPALLGLVCWRRDRLLGLKREHFFSLLRDRSNAWWNLDSVLRDPSAIASPVSFLDELRAAGGYILRVDADLQHSFLEAAGVGAEASGESESLSRK